MVDFHTASPCLQADRQVVQESSGAIPPQNRYTVLDVEGNGLSEESGSSQTRCTMFGSAAEARGKKCASAMVIGDSIVRGIDRHFCGLKQDCRMVCCLPGARVKNVLEQVQDILEGEGEQPVVVVHIGTNDIDKKGMRS